ncbi:MAG: hypothetical protein F6J97_19650 [Leptolyngbya sp. SIO4C1]|nr:hypothetical protein [Leptolyngbya sp. SIO4C1]
MSEFAEAISADEFESDFWPGYEGRRFKAALTLSALWGGTALLHLMTWGQLLLLGFTAFVALYMLRVMRARPDAFVLSAPLSSSRTATSRAQASSAAADRPFVSLLVAAKNEEAVIANLVRSLLLSLMIQKS